MYYPKAYVRREGRRCHQQAHQLAEGHGVGTGRIRHCTRLDRRIGEAAVEPSWLRWPVKSISFYMRRLLGWTNLFRIEVWCSWYIDIPE